MARYLFALWSDQSVPNVERFSRFPWGYWCWAGGGLTLFAIISVVAARAHRQHAAPRFSGAAPRFAHTDQNRCRPRLGTPVRSEDP